MGIRYCELSPEYLKPYQEYRQKQVDALNKSNSPKATSVWKPYVYKKNQSIKCNIEVIREKRLVTWN